MILKKKFGGAKAPFGPNVAPPLVESLIVLYLKRKIPVRLVK